MGGDNGQNIKPPQFPSWAQNIFKLANQNLGQILAQDAASPQAGMAPGQYEQAQQMLNPTGGSGGSGGSVQQSIAHAQNALYNQQLLHMAAMQQGIGVVGGSLTAHYPSPVPLPAPKPMIEVAPEKTHRRILKGEV